MAQHSGWLQQFMLARRFKREIDTALAQDPRDLQALSDLMEYYLLAPGVVGGDKDKARDTAQRIAAVDRARGFAAQARLAEANGDTGKVESMLRRAVEAGPESYRARVALAAFLLSHTNLPGDRLEAARQQAAEAIRIDGTRVDAFAILAAVYAERNQTGELEAVLAAAEKQVPDDRLPYYRSADALLAAGHDLARAERYFRQYLAAETEGNEPTLSTAFWKLGQVLEKLGHTSEAAAEWRQSVRLDRESPAVRDLRRISAKGASL
jgi:tetratricopeptide (TPR) repeat protein